MFQPNFSITSTKISRKSSSRRHGIRTRIPRRRTCLAGRCSQPYLPTFCVGQRQEMTLCRKIQSPKRFNQLLLIIKWPRSESNRHAFRHTVLSGAGLPISPRGQLLWRALSIHCIQSSAYGSWDTRISSSLHDRLPSLHSYDQLVAEVPYLSRSVAGRILHNNTL